MYLIVVFCANRSAEAKVQSGVRITVAIFTVQHPIYFQNVAIGRGTLLAVNAILPSTFRHDYHQRTYFLFHRSKG